MAFRPYLFFGGNCRDAFTRYSQIFGGELNVMTMKDAPEGEPPPGKEDMVIHASVMVGDDVLMGSDDPTGNFSGVRGMYVNYTVGDAAEADRVFAALAEGGEVTMPLAETFWSPAFGMCADRFGTPWMINVEAPEQSS